MALHTISTSCIIVCNNKLLMIQEIQNERVSWDIPAGGLEVGETLYDGIRREVYEEVNLEIKDIELKAVFQFLQSETSSFNFLYYSKLDSFSDGILKPNKEEGIQMCKWFDQNDINELIHQEGYEHELAKHRLLLGLDLMKNHALPIQYILV